MPTIRHATPRDALALAQLGERTFRDAFGPMNTAENMDRHTRERYGEAIQAGEIADPGMTTLVCEADGTLIGFAQLRWVAAPPCVVSQRPGEIQRLYVTSEWHGQGIAQQLMEAALGLMEARGCDAAWLGVWEHNPRAIAFYHKYGFAEVGDLPFSLGDDDQRDLVMARPLVRHPTGRLIIICGLPGAGKTTLAKALERDLGAVRLAPDEWMAVLAIDSYDEASRAKVEALQWELAQRLLALGLTVIIEWGTWARSERDALRIGARALGAAVELRYVSAPLDVLLDRIRQRGREVPPITRESLAEWIALFQLPSDDELALFDPP